ncbi:MAG TPA: hypothetical protein VF328_09595, partial [Mycobacterium sp.]
TDPRRMAVYFAKYGTGGRKDYQHRVPREWLSATVVCDECGNEYDLDLDECPGCGCLDRTYLILVTVRRCGLGLCV